MRALLRNPGFAFAACALVACVWLNQGPSARAYDALVDEVAAGGHPLEALWQPLAFAYRRSQDEELYYAAMNAVRGAPFDPQALLRGRGTASAAFRTYPEADGRWHAPYREVPIEYPALLLPFVAGPAWIAPSFDVFARLFGLLMGALAVLAVALAVERRVPLPPHERAARYGLATLLFLAQGGLLVGRLDAVPTLLLALALRAAIARRPGRMGAWIGLAGAAKILPLVALLPMIAAEGRLRAGGLRWAWRALGGAAAALALGLLAPMLALSPRGLEEMLAFHAARGLHVESTYGVLLSAAHAAIGDPARATLAFGSNNLDTPASWVLARAATPIVIAAVLALSVWLARLPAAEDEAARVDRVACAGLASLLCAWLLGKVFSPQYMTWAIPFVVALAPRSRRAIGAGLLVAMVLTQLYLRGFYDAVYEGRALGVVTAIARLAALVVLAASVARAITATRASSPAR